MRSEPNGLRKGKGILVIFSLWKKEIIQERYFIFEINERISSNPSDSIFAYSFGKNFILPILTMNK